MLHSHQHRQQCCACSWSCTACPCYIHIPELTRVSSRSSLFHGIAQQLNQGQHQGAQGEGAEGGPQGVPEGALGGALGAGQPRGAEVPLGDGPRNGEGADLKHQEGAPQQGDTGEGHVGPHPPVSLPHTAVHRDAFCILAGG